MLIFQVACAINKYSSNVVDDLMANLKIGKGNSVDSIAFHIPLYILKKHSVENQDPLLNNITSNQDITTTQLNSGNVMIHLNKSDFINNMLKNNMVGNIPQRQVPNSKPRIIEFR